MHLSHLQNASVTLYAERRQVLQTLLRSKLLCIRVETLIPRRALKPDKLESFNIEMGKNDICLSKQDLNEDNNRCVLFLTSHFPSIKYMCKNCVGLRT